MIGRTQNIPISSTQRLQIIVEDERIDKARARLIWSGFGLLAVSALVLELRRQQRKNRGY